MDKKIIDELRRKSTLLRKKRDSIFREIEDFYVEVVKTLLKQGVDNIPAIAIYETRGGSKKVDEGIIIENGYLYYVNRSNGVKTVLESEEELRAALRIMFGDLLVLRDPSRVVDDLKEVLNERRKATN